jgi:hypothetical protein
MTLLIETSPATVSKTKGKTIIESIALQGDIMNRNGRWYSCKVLSEACDKVQDQIKSGQFMGTLGHGDSETPELDKVSHVVESLQRKGSNWIMRARVIDEGAGKICSAILSAGAKIGISSRGRGDIVEQHGKKVVQPGFELISLDCVSSPSAPDAWASAITEGIRCRKFSINESAVALSVLKGLGHGLADLQQRNGIDFDSTIGHQLVGHKGFSAEDDRTFLERITAQRDELLTKLDALQNEIDMAQDGLAGSEIKKYARALSVSRTTDPIKSRSLRNEQRHQQYNEDVRKLTMQLLSRIAKS